MPLVRRALVMQLVIGLQVMLLRGVLKREKKRCS